jgi:hypothetical protein
MFSCPFRSLSLHKITVVIQSLLPLFKHDRIPVLYQDHSEIASFQKLCPKEEGKVWAEIFGNFSG